MKTRLGCLVCGLMALAACGPGTSVRAAGQSAAEEMGGAARHFLAALTPRQRAQATFSWEDAERTNWHFIPRERRGLPFKDMSPEQRQWAHALLSTGLSNRGYVKAVTVMSLERILQELEGSNRRFARDPELYFVSIFGVPDPKKPWGWRVEGHHLSLNFTLADGQHLAATPSFFGANPARVQTGPHQGLRVLREEEDLARALVQALTEEQRRVAIIATDAPREILTGSSRKAMPLEPAGLPAAKLTPTQQDRLHQLVETYVRRHRPAIADHDLAKIQQAGWGRISFAWAGGLERGEAHYYRVQGPTFLLEYDNTQNNANHIHSVWRDFDSDFGEDPLRRHYEETAHEK